MREIEFRAWLTEDYPIKTDRKKYIYMNELDLYGCIAGAKNGNVILEQYSTLKDKNKNKLFENDIIFCNGLYLKIIFEDGCFFAAPIENIDSRFPLYRICSDATLKGNIHENKE